MASVAEGKIFGLGSTWPGLAKRLRTSTYNNMQSRFHIVTLAFDRVFDLHRCHGSEGTPKHTLFSFEALSGRQFGVTILDHPRVEDGMHVTAVLRKEDDWQTLMGWVDRDNGQLVPNTSYALGNALLPLGFLGWLAFDLAHPDESSKHYVFDAFAGLFGLGLLWQFVSSFLADRRVMQLLRSIRADLQR
ncbi:hypothetical protein VVD49_17005 [Uliginosibacterium sp. H3]|uniref:Uncharacterized protein n=1 Tax=Uliginosibacterium silvisoli TaxID=3114758 RepID=A0ABU6K713_9RHOO|nr:hypothetical protein [Uliginosibacterium sp. H3]